MDIWHTVYKCSIDVSCFCYEKYGNLCHYGSFYTLYVFSCFCLKTLRFLRFSNLDVSQIISEIIPVIPLFAVSFSHRITYWTLKRHSNISGAGVKNCSVKCTLTCYFRVKLMSLREKKKWVISKHTNTSSQIVSQPHSRLLFHGSLQHVNFQQPEPASGLWLAGFTQTYSVHAALHKYKPHKHTTQRWGIHSAKRI